MSGEIPFRTGPDERRNGLPTLPTAGHKHVFEFRIQLQQSGYIAPVQFLGCRVASGTPRAKEVFTFGSLAGPVPLQLGKVYNVRVLATSAEVGVERALLQFRFESAQAELPPEFSICRKLEVPFLRPGYELIKSQGPYVPPPMHDVKASNVIRGVPPPGRIGNKTRALPKLQMPLKIQVRAGGLNGGRLLGMTSNLMHPLASRKGPAQERQKGIGSDPPS